MTTKDLDKKNLKVEKNLNEIIKAYDSWSENILTNPLRLQGVYLKSKNASFYVRNMARGELTGERVFCIASIEIDTNLQDKGILKGFIEHVQKNMHHFKEIEIENIMSQRLYNFFKNLEFEDMKNGISNEESFYPKTVSKKI